MLQTLDNVPMCHSSMFQLFDLSFIFLFRGLVRNIDSRTRPLEELTSLTRLYLHR